MPKSSIPITSREDNPSVLTSRQIFKAGTFIIALFLIVTGILKVISPSTVINTSRELFPWAGNTLHTIVGSLLPVLELGLGIMLLLRWSLKWTTMATTILFGLFFLISIYGQASGVESDCGCFGGVITSSFGWGMLTRNSFLFLWAALLCNREFKKTNNHE